MTAIKMTSNKPYIVKAFYDWISDNQLTPYIVVDATIRGVMVPMSYVQNGEIVLNISYTAVGAIALTDKAIEFSARFGGKLENLYVPYGAIAAIYAKENGAGTALPIEPIEEELADELSDSAGLTSVENSVDKKTDEDLKADASDKSKEKKRPSLKVVK